MTLPKNPEKNRIVTAATAKMLLKVFMACYCIGARDAAEADDEGLCLEYLERTMEPCVWGRVNDRRLSDDYVDWVVFLHYAAREAKRYAPMSLYLRNAGRYGSNYLSVALPISLEWYRKGVEDYISNPMAADVYDMDISRRTLWTDKGLRSMAIEVQVDITQGMIRQRRDADMECNDATKAIIPKKYASFRRAISLASTPRLYSYYG